MALGSRTLGTISVFLMATLCAAVPVATLGQTQDRPATESVAEAARAARDRLAQTGSRAPIITNDSLPSRPAPAAPSTLPLGSAQNAQLDLPASADAGCHDASAAQAIGLELQATQDDRDRLEGELSYQSPVISGNDLDIHNYQPGYSGISVGSQPLQESQPQPAARVDLADVNGKIAALKKSLQLACDSPEAAELQKQLNALDSELNRSQRQLALDQNDFYLNPNYQQNTLGQARLDSEQASIDALVAKKEALNEQLVTLQGNQPQTEPANGDQTASSVATEPPPPQP